MSEEIRTSADAVPFVDNQISSDLSLSSADMIESSDRVNNYQWSAETRDNSSNHTQSVGRQVVIQNPTGVVHLGPVYNLNFGSSSQPTQSAAPAPVNDNQSSHGREKPPKEEMRPLWLSKRVVDQEDITLLSKHIGARWKEVGNGLKFDWAKLEQFEADTNSMSDAILRMLFRWIQWKDQKATVGKLTKVLFNNEEFDAIRCLKP